MTGPTGYGGDIGDEVKELPVKAGSRIFSCAAPLLLATLLAGCGAMRGEHRSDAHDSHAMMDVKSMCEMHRKMMAGKTPAQEQAHMDEHMKSMSPEMRKKMQDMHAQCR
jgi:hypothetical protein